MENMKKVIDINGEDVYNDTVNWFEIKLEALPKWWKQNETGSNGLRRPF